MGALEATRKAIHDSWEEEAIACRTLEEGGRDSLLKSSLARSLKDVIDLDYEGYLEYLVTIPTNQKNEADEDGTEY